MSVTGECPACGHVFQRPDGLAGRLEKCPACRAVVRMPAVVPSPSSEPCHPPTPQAMRPTTEGVRPRRTYEEKYGCLVAWLLLMIVVNVLAAPSYLLMCVVLPHVPPGGVTLAFLLGCACSGLGVVCAVALLQGRKWGFYGFLTAKVLETTSGLALAEQIGMALVGLTSVTVLFILLHIGGHNKAWRQLG
jgi:hypothetical protein